LAITDADIFALLKPQLKDIAVMKNHNNIELCANLGH